MGTTADKLNKLKETKQAIKAAIVNKGVEVTDTDTFASYASKIDSIQTGGSGGGFVIPNGVKLGYSTVIPDNIDTSNVTDMRDMFNYCSRLTTIPLIDTSNAINMDYMFNYCYNLTSIPLIDTSNVTGMSHMFNGCNNLAYLKLINLGTQSLLESLDLSECSSLGDDTKVAGSRQALIDTLITYSFDRATAGYTKAFTITLNAATKALLTEDEIAQITAKGFTIA